jgi:hypothetical protein
MIPADMPVAQSSSTLPLMPRERFHVEHSPAASSQAVLLQIISRVASDSTIDLDRVERLLEMHGRLAAQDAERQFTEAMAQFKAVPLTIQKDKLVSFTTTKGTTQYRHATIGAVCEAIIPGLAAVGISHRWDLERREARIFVTCVLTHRAGYSTRTTWDGPLDDSGSKNLLQQSASTITYLERYTLLAATGIGVSESDDDGKKGGDGGKKPDLPEPPAGYDSWKADMGLVEGHEALKRAWNGSPPEFRAYASNVDMDWWAATRAKNPRSVS